MAKATKYLKNDYFLFAGKSTRGFNMFSAVVAIILVMTGVVLTSTLISTEEKATRQVYSMLNNYELSDTASLARSDALQSFNYNFREKLENYLTFNNEKLSNEPGFELFRIDSTGKQFTFDEMKASFEKVILLTDRNEGLKFDAAITYVADRTVDQFQGGTYGKYSVYLSDNGPAAKMAIYAATKEAISAQGQNFLEVVGCDESACDNGSFYFNIPLNVISDKSYEALPRIVVKDLVSQEEIKMAILPRTNIKVYIPLRFFKALYEARKTALALEDAHNLLDSYRLGFCDGPAICSPRTNAISPATNPTWDRACPVSGFDAPISLGGYSADELANIGTASYLGGDKTGPAKILKPLGAMDICRAGANRGAFSTTGDPTFIIKPDLSGNLVLTPGKDRAVAIGGCGIETLTVVVNPEATHKISTSEDRLVCSRVTAVYADVVFAELNPAFIVKGTAEAGVKDYYKIRITDAFFAPPVVSTFTDSLLPTCYSEGSDSRGSCTPR